jgi:aspartyl aminopeptidase
MLSLLRKPSTLQIPKSVVYSVKKNYSTEKKDALGLLDFINASPSPFHCVKESAERLENAGFHKLKEKETWDLKRNGKYYFTRNGSALVAFAVGGGYQAGKGGFSVVGAHTDSPCLKVKPISKKENAGYLSVGVQLYGGGIW